ncbi:hypothetical protein D3C81_1721350 [compost metagenome]
MVIGERCNQASPWVPGDTKAILQVRQHGCDRARRRCYVISHYDFFICTATQLTWLEHTTI